jgi:phosphatidylglycerophosphate synthase
VSMIFGYDGKTSWFGWMCAGAVYIYTVADHLDGMQARRSRLGTPLGALLDHLCDFFNGCFIVLGACAASGTYHFILILMTFLFVIAFTISHLEAAVRRELWLGDEFWLGTHTPLEGLIVIMAYFLVSRYIGEWYWLFLAYFLYKLLAVILNVQRRLWHNSHGQFYQFVVIFLITLIPAWLHDGLLGILFWLVSVLFSGAYLFEVLAIRSEVGPRPRRLVLVAIGFAFLSIAWDQVNPSISVSILTCLAVAQTAKLVVGVRVFATAS